MRRLFAVVFGVILGGGAVYFAFQYHVVRTENEWLFVRKAENELKDTYVDVRNWSANDWLGHVALAQALTQEGRSDLIVKPQADNLIEDIFRSLRSGRASDSPAERR